MEKCKKINPEKIISHFLQPRPPRRYLFKHVIFLHFPVVNSLSFTFHAWNALPTSAASLAETSHVLIDADVLSLAPPDGRLRWAVWQRWGTDVWPSTSRRLWLRCLRCSNVVIKQIKVIILARQMQADNAHHCSASWQQYCATTSSWAVTLRWHVVGTVQGGFIFHGKMSGGKFSFRNDHGVCRGIFSAGGVNFSWET